MKVGKIRGNEGFFTRVAKGTATPFWTQLTLCTYRRIRNIQGTLHSFLVVSTPLHIQCR
jgi:hypothetical protein